MMRNDDLRILPKSFWTSDYNAYICLYQVGNRDFTV